MGFLDDNSHRVLANMEGDAHRPWLSETEFIDDVKGQTRPELWESFRNIRSGVFVNQVNGYQFFITRSPAIMRKTGEVIGRIMKDDRASGDERVIYYWNMPQWKAKSVYFYT